MIDLEFLGYWLRGALFGVIFVISLQYIAFHQILDQLFRAKSITKTHTPQPPSQIPVPHIHTDPWPEHILEYIATAGDGPCVWINVFLHRYFIELRASTLFKTKSIQKIQETLEKKGKGIVAEILVVDLDLGDHPPIISDVKVARAESAIDSPVVVELRLAYSGSASITIETRLIGGLTVTVKVYLKSLDGKLLIRTPSIKWADMMCVSFPENPNVNFIVDSPITLRDNQTVRDMVNGILSKIVKRAFIETWVAPHWRNFYLPLLQPPHDLVELRSTGALLPCPSRPCHASTLSQSAILQSATNKYADCFQGSLFAADAVLNDGSIESYKEWLVDRFNFLITDNTDWATVSSKSGILIQTLKVVHKDASTSEVTKCIFNVPIEPHLVFFVSLAFIDSYGKFLANPTHLTHIQATYQMAGIVKQADDFTHIRGIKISDKIVQVFDTRVQSGDEYIIANRSIGGYEASASTGSESIFIYGYHIKAGVIGTQITAVSQVSKELIELNFGMVKKLKTFIEQLYATNEEKEGYRLRSVVATTASLAKKGWSMLSPTFASLGKKLVTQKTEYEMRDIPSLDTDVKHIVTIAPSVDCEGTEVLDTGVAEVDLSSLKQSLSKRRCTSGSSSLASTPQLDQLASIHLSDVITEDLLKRDNL